MRRYENDNSNEQTATRRTTDTAAQPSGEILHSGFAVIRQTGRRLCKAGVIFVTSLYGKGFALLSVTADEPYARSSAFASYLDKHPKIKRFFRSYRRFLLVTVTLGASLLVFGLFGVKLYTLLSAGQIQDAMTQSALPMQAVASAESEKNMQERMLRSSTYFSEELSLSYLFRTQNGTPVWGADWEEEGALSQPLVLPSVPPGMTDDSLYYYDASQIPDDMAGICPMDLSALSLSINNGTAHYEPQLEVYAENTYPILPQTGTAEAPAVLILHTHATECYAEANNGYYDPKNDMTRSKNEDENMIAVGTEMARAMEQQGVHVLHLTEQFDAISYNESYSLAAKAIQETLAAYPSISYVFDVHRDSMVQTDGTKIRPVTLAGESPAAQIMLVVGTDEGGGNHPRWRDNLTVAAHMQRRMIDSGTGLARPLNLRSATFNEQYTTGSLLVEIGSTGNTLDEAKNSARLFGRLAAQCIMEGA